MLYFKRSKSIVHLNILPISYYQMIYNQYINYNYINQKTNINYKLISFATILFILILRKVYEKCYVFLLYAYDRLIVSEL